MRTFKNNKEIGEEAVEKVCKYELARTGVKPKPEPEGNGVDVKSGDRVIEVKGCKKKISNMRITNQTMKWVEEHDEWDNFYIYAVSYLETEKPTLQIMTYNEVKKYIRPEITHTLQPNLVPFLKEREQINLEEVADDG